jgi:hypothetical protein
VCWCLCRSFERDDESQGGVLAKGAAQAGGRLAEKVYNAAGMAAQVRCKSPIMWHGMHSNASKWHAPA